MSVLDSGPLARAGPDRFRRGKTFGFFAKDLLWNNYIEKNVI